MRKSTVSHYSQALLDEGYCEDPLNMRSLLSAPLPQWLLQMSVAERTGYVMKIISHLPTSQVAEIVNHLRPRLYINFFEHLPNEVLLLILSFLDPISLFNTALASRQWMSLALDSKLWEQLYFREGFRVISSEVERFEEELNQTLSESTGLDDALTRSYIGTPIPCNNSALLGTESMAIDDKEKSEIETLPEYKKQEETALSESKSCNLTARHSGLSSTTTNQTNQSYCRKSASSVNSMSDLNESSLFSLDYNSSQMRYQLNWQYLYSQRRRLEANWEAEKYVNFQLPDPSHPEEAHSECIYTIQYSGKYLVSGSRDKTIRIWSLETRRLVRPPLRAHSGSVLCLQFDADPEEDLIVSGSSDTTIVLWKFSTGKIVQRLRTAHDESVLNVQFDKRILVTCSKDRTIKIFNRKPMYVRGSGYPIDERAVNPVPTLLNNYGLNSSPVTGINIKPAYSLIATLEGHVAAVNAVQIQGDEIVSASGDRYVKVWNWRKQVCVRTLVGHSKGIACVQYDGRRIVSGSSDNEVKVFDKETGLEVASLRAHTNLVRTVQAGFGDLPFSPQKDKADAKAVDYEYFKALDSGAISSTIHSERGRPHNAGSRRPENITAYGAKLPPGGGGGKFGRIVSGSYDETIIIWRRDKEGVWKAQHVLRQEEAAQAALNNIQVQSESPETFVRKIFYHQLIKDAVSKGPNALRYILVAYPQALNYHEYLRKQIYLLPQDIRQTMKKIVAAANSSDQSVIQSKLSISHQSSIPIIQSNSTQAIQHVESIATESETSPLMAVRQASTPIINPISTLGSRLIHSPTAQAHTHNFHDPPNQNINSEITRVFKLQFDARRIICCSQTNVVVGWDFANNDQKLIEASRFFAPIE